MSPLSQLQDGAWEHGVLSVYLDGFDDDQIYLILESSYSVVLFQFNLI